jgi:hypothetical protein
LKKKKNILVENLEKKFFEKNEGLHFFTKKKSVYFFKLQSLFYEGGNEE